MAFCSSAIVASSILNALDTAGFGLANFKTSLLGGNLEDKVNKNERFVSSIFVFI